MTQKSLKDKIIDFSRRIVFLEKSSQQSQIKELENIEDIKENVNLDNFKKIYKDVFLLLSKNNLLKYNSKERNTSDDIYEGKYSTISIRSYEQKIGNESAEVLVKLNETFDTSKKKEVKECQFLINNEEVFKVKLVENRYTYESDDYLSFYVQGDYLDKEHGSKLLESISAMKIFKAIKSEQDELFSIEKEKENLEKIKKSQKNEFLVNNMLDKISAMNHSDLVEKKVEIRKRGLN